MRLINSFVYLLMIFLSNFKVFFSSLFSNGLNNLLVLDQFVYLNSYLIKNLSKLTQDVFILGQLTAS